MYSQSEIQSAIEAGILKTDTADALQQHIEKLRDRPIQDEENFRLVSSFNDIFVAIAAIIMLFAARGIGDAIDDTLSGIFVAVTAWGLAEFFTRKRRMAFPSIILLLAFVSGVFFSIATLLAQKINVSTSVLASMSSAITAVFVYLHWKRFKVPITIAAGIAAIAATIIAAILAIIGNRPDQNIALILVLIAGLATFAFAMWWDISDKARQTRRSDIAFWLHLLAAPMIAHPLFSLIGATGSDEITELQAGAIIIAYIIMGTVAIIIDRRAMLVSALAYVLIALAFLFNKFGAIELNVALTAFVIGLALLSLSAFWTPLRRKLVNIMPPIIKDNIPTT